MMPISNKISLVETNHMNLLGPWLSLSKFHIIFLTRVLTSVYLTVLKCQFINISLRQSSVWHIISS